jgi:hypothetical protein
LTCCCAAIIYPPTVCLILFFHQPKRAVGRESIKQFHHFAQLLLQLTRTLTVDASPVLLPKSVARRERGGIKLLLQLIICQRLVATTAAVWFSVLVVSNDQIIIIKKMGLGEREKTRKEFQGSISVCVLRWTISPAGLVNCFIEFRCGGGGGPIDDIWYRR